MDAQIILTILPKLHGSKRKIGALLAALARYCEERSLDDARKQLEQANAADTYPAAGDGVFVKPAFPESHRKLCAMLVAVRRDQFVSFIQ